MARTQLIVRVDSGGSGVSRRPPELIAPRVPHGGDDAKRQRLSRPLKNPLVFSASS
jgi:hypothetical protein